jgi:uncharacterized protein
MRGMSDGPVIPIQKAQRRCPICGKPSAPARFPFCSPRCANIDLGRWLNGSYAVPTDEPADDPSAENEPR